VADNNSASGAVWSAFFFGVLWFVHWLTSDVVVTSDAGFFDGMAHGSFVSVNSIRSLFGEAPGIQDFFAGWAYDLGFALGACAWFGMATILCGWFIGEIFDRGGSSDQETAVAALSVVIAVILGALGFFIGDAIAPAPVPGELVPPLLGFIGGGTRIWLIYVGPGVTVVLLLLCGGLFSIEAISRTRSRRKRRLR